MDLAKACILLSVMRRREKVSAMEEGSVSHM